MKRILAITLAACLLASGMALAEGNGAKVGSIGSARQAAEASAAPTEAALTADDADAEAADAEVDGTEAQADDAVEAEPEAQEADTAEAEAVVDTDGAEPEETSDAGEDVPADAAEAEAEPADEAGDEDAPEAPTEIELWFEEGFALTLPAGWASYPVSDEEREAGLRYLLGDGEHFMYIEFQDTALERIDELPVLVEKSPQLTFGSSVTIGNRPFVIFSDESRTASGFATMWGRQIVSFLFTPADEDFAAGLLKTFTTM